MIPTQRTGRYMFVPHSESNLLLTHQEPSPWSPAIWGEDTNKDVILFVPTFSWRLARLRALPLGQVFYSNCEQAYVAFCVTFAILALVQEMLGNGGNLDHLGVSPDKDRGVWSTSVRGALFWKPEGQAQCWEVISTHVKTFCQKHRLYISSCRRHTIARRHKHSLIAQGGFLPSLHYTISVMTSCSQ